VDVLLSEKSYDANAEIEAKSEGSSKGQARRRRKKETINVSKR
jgi:hypothetical protein